MEYPIKTPLQLGAVLKGFRRERNLTQTQIGASAGLPQNVISEIESDPSRRGLERVFKLISALDLELVVRPRQARRKRSEW